MCAHERATWSSAASKSLPAAIDAGGPVGRCATFGAHVLNLRNLDRGEMGEALAALRRERPRWRAGSSRMFMARVARASPDFRPAACAASRTSPPPRWRAPATWPDLEIIERRRAADGFVKYLFRTADGHAIEAVRIPLPDPAEARALKERRRAGQAASLEALPTAKYTLCLSSQVGCALACDFCATGRLGGIRSLKTWEILAQHRADRRRGRPPDPRGRLHGDGRAVPELRERHPRRAHPERSGRAGHLGQGDLRSPPPACSRRSAASPPRGTTSGSSCRWARRPPPSGAC